MTVGIAITVVWLVQRAPEPGRATIVEATSASADTAADDLAAASVSRSTEFSGDSRGAQHGGNSERAERGCGAVA